MRKLETGTTKHTEIYAHSTEGQSVARYDVVESIVEPNVDATVLSEIYFQNGPIKETGLHGIFIEDALVIAHDRLSVLNTGKFECEYNDRALRHIEQALQALRERTNDRAARQVEGTNKE